LLNLIGDQTRRLPSALRRVAMAPRAMDFKKFTAGDDSVGIVFQWIAASDIGDRPGTSLTKQTGDIADTMMDKVSAPTPPCREKEKRRAICPSS